MTNRRQLMQGALASILGLTHLPNFAQTRLENLRIIVGFPPGGTTDAFSRRIAEKMRGTYANNVIVDNKPGAGGQIGVTTLKSAAADGAHILYSPASMLTIYPHSYSRLSYAQSDVTPIGIGHSTDHAFVVGPAVPDSVKLTQRDINGFTRSFYKINAIKCHISYSRDDVPVLTSFLMFLI